MTSGHGDESPAVTASAPHNGENKPPQAIVKPQVLTHVIEGFVIQEGAEPFPVCVSLTLFSLLSPPSPCSLPLLHHHFLLNHLVVKLNGNMNLSC